MSTQLIDGNRTLGQQEADLNLAEQGLFSKVMAYTKAQTGTNNEVTLEVVPLGQNQPSALHLILATQGAPAGSDKVFQSSIFVEGAEKTVIGFRQAAAAAKP